MGLGNSAPKVPEASNTGQANNANSITITEDFVQNDNMQTYFLLGIAIVQLVKLLLYIYTAHKKALKKKYGPSVQTVSATV